MAFTRQCQKNDWNEHRRECQNRPDPVGCPFLVCLPKSQCTAKKLYEVLKAHSKYSVDVSCCSRSSITSQTDETESRETSSPRNFNIRFFPKDQDKDENGIVLDLPQEAASEEEKEDVPLSEEVLNTFNLILEWNNRIASKECVVVESKELDHSYDILEGDAICREQTPTLEDCLSAFTEPETLSPQEAWYCPRCKEHREATKQLKLWRLPNLLIIQLKRFSFRNMLFREKIDKFIEYPLKDLDLSDYSSFNHHQAGKQKPIYDLYGVINHYGGMFGGHYVAYAKTSHNKQALGKLTKENATEL